ncbi:MAG: hypothetical protein MUF00_17225 [Gemmatimonadaceae bacterium]|jgi:hypothetical protein|nr:hypothetical protein [Gemmatimonadaceae bacterium]
MPLSRIGPFILALAGATPLAAQSLTAPNAWQWRTDQPARLVATGDSVGARRDAFWFVAMPPGFHLTMGPGGVLYHPEVTASGRFTVESEQFCFPETGTNTEYGLALGGRRLDGAAEWISFVLRGDGHAAVLRQTGTQAAPVRVWQPGSSVVARRADGAVRNVLRVVVGDTLVRFQVNGADVAQLPRRGLALEGIVGLRAGAGANLHVTSLDVTRHTAPARP